MRLLTAIYLLFFGTMLLWIGDAMIGAREPVNKRAVSDLATERKNGKASEAGITPGSACHAEGKSIKDPEGEALNDPEERVFPETTSYAEGETLMAYETENTLEAAARVERTAVICSAEEIAILERIVEAEAGGEDAEGKLLVANVVLNRVRDAAFPDSIEGVVFQQSDGVTQFSPVANGRYEAVTISEESRSAVKRALDGEDISEGALYFAARKHADPKNMKWFDDHLTMLFQHGGHEFFK